MDDYDELTYYNWPYNYKLNDQPDNILYQYQIIIFFLLFYEVCDGQNFMAIVI